MLIVCIVVHHHILVRITLVDIVVGSHHHLEIHIEVQQERIQTTRHLITKRHHHRLVLNHILDQQRHHHRLVPNHIINLHHHRLVHEQPRQIVHRLGEDIKK
jgi:hypothetical protein